MIKQAVDNDHLIKILPLKILTLLIFIQLIFILNPAMSSGTRSINGYDVYYGLFHAHNSEGGDDNKRSIATLEYAYKFARETGRLDFFGITPHSHMIDNNFFSRLRREHKRYAEPGFAPLYGAEWGVMSSTGHIGILGSNKMLCDKIPVKSNIYEYLNRIFQLIIDDPDCHAILNHPETFDFGYYYNPLADEQVNSVEVFSGSAFETRVDMARSSSSYEDRILVLLNRGWHVGAVANQDNHFPTYGVATETRTGVIADNFSSDAIMKHLKKRNTFASQDKNLAVLLKLNIGNKDYLMGSEISNARGKAVISVVTDDLDGEIPDKIILYSDIVDCGEIGKKVISVSDTCQLTYEFEPDYKERFYIAQIVQKDGHKAWSSPVWISKLDRFQLNLNRLLLAKKQYKAAHFHYNHVIKNLDLPAESYFLKKLGWSKNYLQNICETYSKDAYKNIFNSKSDSLRRFLKKCAEFLVNLPPHDAVLFFDDLKVIASELALTTDEGEFIDSFVKSTHEEVEKLYLKKDKLLEYAENLMKAKNFAGAAMIYSILEDRFPEESELLKTKMMDVYKSLEAYQAVIDTGDAILSDPSLDRDTAIDIYIAKGLTYLRVSSQSNIKNDKIRYLDLAKQQFLQLLKDFRKIDIAVKGTVEELIGDCAYKQMSDKNLDTKAMYKEAVKYFNRALTRTDNLSKILKLNEKISNSTLRFNADIESIKSVISDFEQLRQEFGPSRETDMLLQNLGDLKLRLAQKSKDPEEKKECLKSAVDLYKEYIRVIKPKTRDNINFAVANILKQMGQNSKAVDYYKKIEAESFKSRKLESALFNMIYCYSNMKKYDQAILTAKRLLSDFPNFKPCYQNYKNKEVTDPMDSVVGRKLQNLQAQESGLDFSDMTDLDNPEIEYFYIPDTLDNYCNN